MDFLRGKTESVLAACEEPSFPGYKNGTAVFLQRQLSHRGERNPVTGNVLKCSSPLFLHARLLGCHLHLQRSIAQAMNIYPPLCNMEPDRGVLQDHFLCKGSLCQVPCSLVADVPKSAPSSVAKNRAQIAHGSHPGRQQGSEGASSFFPHLANRELPWHCPRSSKPKSWERNGAQLRERPPGTQGRTGLEAIDHVVMALNCLGFGPKWLHIQKDYDGS